MFNRKRNGDSVLWRKKEASRKGEPRREGNRGESSKAVGSSGRPKGRLLGSAGLALRHVWLGFLNIGLGGRLAQRGLKGTFSRALLAFVRGFGRIAENFVEEPLRRFIAFVAVLWGLAALFGATSNGFDAKVQAALWIAGGAAVLAVLPVPYALSRLIQGRSGATVAARTRRADPRALPAPARGANAPADAVVASRSRAGVASALAALVLIAGIGYGAFAGSSYLWSNRARLFSPMLASAPSSAATLVGRGVALGGNRLRVGKQEVQLFGIKVPSRDERCGEGRRAWTCGRQAQNALAKQLSGQTLRCTPRGTGEGDVPLVVCTVKDEEFNARLIETGIGRVAAGDPAGYARLEKAARESGVGIWKGQSRASADASQN